MSDYRIGKIVNTFGIRGQVKVIVDSDFAEERFEEGTPMTIVRDGEVLAEVTIESAQMHKGTFNVSFEQYHNINQVEAFKNAWLMIDKSLQTELPEDEFYHHQIIGLKVVTTEGEELGTIKEILQLGSNDVWVVKRNQPKLKDALIPYIDQIVKKVDLDQQLVTIELMEGLIDDEN